MNWQPASGDWQPDANSILEDFIQFHVNRIPLYRQTAAKCEFAHSCELATGSQMPIRC